MLKGTHVISVLNLTTPNISIFQVIVKNKGKQQQKQKLPEVIESIFSSGLGKEIFELLDVRKSGNFFVFFDFDIL